MAAELPDDFRCPISLELMSDPVILTSGHTFDRSSIQRWLDSGHRTCPVTKLPLPDHPFLIPNHALRSLISSYLTANAIPRETEPDPKTHSRHQKPDPQTLISSLTARSSSLPSKLDSLTRLSRILKHDPSSRRRISELGAASAALRCLDWDDIELQQKSLSLLLNLSLDDDNKVGLVAEGAIGRIVAGLLSGGEEFPQALAATLLTSLAVLEVNKATIGAYPGAIKALISLLRSGKGLRERKEAATALYTICQFAENRRRAVSCGAVPVLVKALAEGMGLERAVEVLGLLGKCKEGKEEMVKVDGIVGILVGVLRNGGSRRVQYGLMTLNSLCCWSDWVCGEAKREGVLEICSGFLEDDNEKIKRSASGLIEVLKGG